MNYSKIEVDKARPRKGLFQSIRTKLIVYFCLLFTVAIAIIVLADLRGLPFTQFAGTKDQQKMEAFRSLNLVADLKKERLLRWMKERRDDAKVASSNDMMRDNVALLRAAIREFTARGMKDARLWALAREEKSYRNLLSYIEVVKTAYGVYQNIHIADAETGKIIVSSNEAYLGIDVSKDLSFAGGLSSHDAYTTDIVFDPRDNFADFHISHSIADKECEVIAIWVLEVRPEDIIRPMLHGGEGLGEKGEALLVNGDVRILTSLKHPLPDGTRAKPLEYKIKAKPGMFAAHGKEGIIEAEDYRGETVLAAYRHVRMASELGWGLVVSRDKTELFAPLRKHIAYSVFIGLTSIFIVVVLIIFLARDLTRPIISLSRTADRIADGDLDARALVTTSDETGHLVVTFNSMIQQIQNWHKELEEQVNARTADLKKSNRAFKMISEGNRALVRAMKESNLLHDMCRIVVDFGGYRLAWIGIAEQDEKKTVRPVAHAGYEEGYLDTVNITWSDTEQGRGSTGTAIRTGRPSICKDMLTDPKYTPWRSEAIKRGYESSISLPLISEDRTLGALNIYAEQPDAFDTVEVQLLMELADDLVYGIMALRTQTDCIRAEEALRLERDNLRNIFESIEDGIYIVNQQYDIQYVNPVLVKDFGSYEGIKCYKYFHDRDEICTWCKNQDVFAGKTVRWEWYSFKNERTFDLIDTPMTLPDGTIGKLEIFRDITERKRAEDLVRNFSQMLMQAQERERQMISCELHDSIAQNLFTLKIDCDMLFYDQPAISHELKVKMAKISDLIDQTIIDVRNLSYDLRPPDLDEIGLVKMLEIYCEEFSENSGVKVDFQSAGIQKLNFDSNAEIHLYRLVQEGLNNIRKHAHATRATIKMVRASPDIILRIEDDGKGFDVKARELALDKEKRLGIRSMKERVNLLGGQMTIHSRLMKGTKIFIKYPIHIKTV